MSSDTDSDNRHSPKNTSRRRVVALMSLWLLISAMVMSPCPAADLQAHTTPSATIRLTPEETTWLKRHPLIHVGIDPSWAPIEFMSDNGIPQGISIQYLAKLEKMLGIHFRVSPGLSWPEVTNRLHSGHLDLLPAMSVTPARQALFNFTTPYLTTPNAIFSAVDRAYLGNLAALKGRRITVVKGYAIESWLREHYPKLKLITAPNIPAALKMIASGQAYAFIGNLITTSYYIGKTGLTQIKVAGETDFSNKLSMAVRKDWKIFAGILQKGLDTIPQYEREAIYNDWISIKYQHSVDYTLLWQVLAISALLLFVSLFWNHRLVREIAQRQRIEAALNIARREAEQATQVKSQFLANMSHELRTPINAIMGLGHFMLESKLTPEQREYATKMQTSSRSLLDIVNSILSFSRGEALRLQLETESFNLQKMLQNIIDTLEAQASEKQLPLVLLVDPTLPEYLVGDKCKLRQILLNLGCNAIKFSDSGQVRFTITRLQSETNTVQIRFSVSDDGPGIDPEIQKKLFNPFFQGDGSMTRSHGGTGLGLSISQQFARVMGSQIKVASNIGSGSIFAFDVTLEISRKREATEDSPARCEIHIPKKTTTLKNASILLVEDDALSRLVAKKFLATMVGSVTTAENGHEALNALRERQFDIVLMDIQMPEMDGCEATAKIRETLSWRHLPIIALTAHAMPGEREKYLAAGMDDYLTKPLDPDKLKAILEKWISLVQATTA